MSCCAPINRQVVIQFGHALDTGAADDIGETKAVILAFSFLMLLR